MDHLSSSQINQYLMCPRKYKFKYVEEIQPTFKSAALAFGSAVHSAISYLAEERRVGNGVNIAKTLSVFRSDWAAQRCDDIRFKEGEQEADYLDKGVALLKLFYDESQEWQIKASEMSFRVPVIDIGTGEEIIPVSLVGFVDLVLEPDAVIEIKTGMRKWDEEAVKNNIQVSLYAYAYKLLFGREPELAIKVLLKQRTPRIETYPTTRSPDDIRWCLNLVREVYESIEKGAFHPCPGWLCGDCEHKEICKEINGKKGGDHVE